MSPQCSPEPMGRCWGDRGVGWGRKWGEGDLAQNVGRGGQRWLAREKCGEVPVHHGNGPFAMIGCPGVNNANGIGRVNWATWLNRRNMQRSARAPINQPHAALRGRQDLKFRSGDGSSHNPRWRGNLFCLYLFTARRARSRSPPPPFCILNVGPKHSGSALPLRGAFVPGQGDRSGCGEHA